MKSRELSSTNLPMVRQAHPPELIRRLNPKSQYPMTKYRHRGCFLPKRKFVVAGNFVIDTNADVSPVCNFEFRSFDII